MGALARLHAPAKFSHTKSSGGDRGGMKGAAGGTSKAPPPRPTPARPYIRGRRRRTALRTPECPVCPSPALCARRDPHRHPASPLTVPLKLHGGVTLLRALVLSPGSPSPLAAPALSTGSRAGRRGVLRVRVPSTLKMKKAPTNKTPTPSETLKPTQTTTKKQTSKTCPKLNNKANKQTKKTKPRENTNSR